MKKIVVTCDVREHNDEPAVVQGFRFYWPDTDYWYEIDLCKGCRDAPPIPSLVEQVKPATYVGRLDPVDERPVSRGVKWILAINTGAKGLGLEHAVPVTGPTRSYCGQIKDKSQIRGPATGSARLCKVCVASVNLRLTKQNEEPADEKGD